MRAIFTLSLIDVLSVLLPGSVALAALLYAGAPSLAARMETELWLQLVFVACGYLAGHMLTTLSAAVIKLRQVLRAVSHPPMREQAMVFYPLLQARLQEVFGPNLSRDDEYLLALRLVTDNLPRSAQEIDRLYALTLFARNMVIAVAVAAVAAIAASPALSLALAGAALLFFVRYIQMESATSDTVFRTAYTYLCTSRRAEHTAARGEDTGH
jgi:hypothetical protein